MKQWLHTTVLASAVIGLATTAGAATAPLVVEGKARAVIVLPARPEALERQAARELSEHLALMTGAELAVVEGEQAAAERIPVYLGSAADPALDVLSRAAGENPSTFTLRVAEDRIDIRGLSAEGTLFGVYELLEQLGFRWYVPGDLGRVVPQGDTANVTLQTETQAPAMELRLLQPWSGATSGWIARQRLGGRQRSTGKHGIPPFDERDREKLFEQHPEYFALIGGERRMRQICAGNPAAAELTARTVRARFEPTTEKFYVGMGPRDGDGYCECDLCGELDGGVPDPLYGGQTSKTGRYIAFFNRVLELLEDDYPNLHIVWYVYANHMMPPPQGLEPNPRIVGVFAPITIDRIRGMDNPMSPDRHVFRWLIDAWAATGPNELCYRGYYNNLACVQLPKTQIDRVRNEIPALHERGVNVMRVECIHQSWASDPLTLYLAARLMWNVNLDVDRTLDEFYRLFYGPAEQPMRAYHEQLEAAFRDTPYFTGSSFLYFPIFMDHPRRAALRGLLDEAQRLAGDGDSPSAARVHMIRQGYVRMDAFLDMMLARNRHDFAESHRRMEQFDALTQELVDLVLEDGNPRQSHRGVSFPEGPTDRRSYFNRYFREPVLAGHRRTVREGELVAPLSDEWLFLLDPTEIGEIAGYPRPGELGGNWQPIKSSSRSWSDQGLHYYKGVAWYRQKVTIPAQFADRPVYLWFGGVDRLASVWVNGQFVGSSREPGEGLPGIPGSMKPFDLAATGAVRFGVENWVVVRTENKSLAELGTGGILAPVMFWSPKDPDWKP
jgi:hypothetical protein